MALAALGGAVAPAAAAQQAPVPRVVLVLVDGGFDSNQLAEILPEASPGGLSAGLSNVPTTQTYLDISQGNRVFTSLYPSKIPKSFRAGADVPGWKRLVDRAHDAPADTVPGLLGGQLGTAGVPVRVAPQLRTPAVIGVDRAGRIGRGAPGECIATPCLPGFNVVYANRPQLQQIAAGLDLDSGKDLLIVLERPPPAPRRLLTMGVLGTGFHGNLTSPTTRSPGLVTTADLTATVLDRFGIAIPKEVIGKPIETEGEPDAAAVTDRNHRLSVIGKRRDAAIFDNALLWLLAALVAIAVTRGRAARVALPLLALACVYLPLMLMLTAALDPTRIAERLIVGIGAPLLGLITWRALRGPAALAVACGLTVGAYGIDVILGSPLTALSLIGSNPVIGVRFFGIGNELESTVAVLAPVGVGAGLAAYESRRPRDDDGRFDAAVFLAAGALAAIVFGLGRFGADVGAVIVLPVGAAVAAAVATGATRNRRTLAAIIAAPVAALLLLAGLDLALGGGAHLTGSVLHAGGSGEIGDVFERRLRLSGKSFGRNADSPYLYLSAAVLVLAIVKRRTISSWFEGRRPALAGLCGAGAATIVGTLANDSGALLLMVGMAYVLAAAAFFWATRPPVT